MRLKEIMTTSVESIEVNATVQQAAKKMKVCDVGMLPVTDKGRVVGIVTDRDLVTRALAEGRTAITVREAMTPDPIMLEQNRDVEDAVQTMVGHRIGRLVVKDTMDRMVGVVSAADLAVSCAGDAKIGKLAESLSRSHRHVGLPTTL